MFGRKTLVSMVAGAAALAGAFNGVASANAAGVADLINPASAARPAAVAAADSSALDLIVRETNQERRAAGLQDLVVVNDVTAAAQAYAEQLVATGAFEHANIQGMLTGNRTIAGENLFAGFGNDAAGRAVAGWMNSEGHRANILNDRFTGIGIGIATRANGEMVVVQRFVG